MTLCSLTYFEMVFRKITRNSYLLPQTRNVIVILRMWIVDTNDFLYFYDVPNTNENRGDNFGVKIDTTFDSYSK